MTVMGVQTLSWAVSPEPGQRTEGQRTEGLRERKKRLMRQQLSDTATRMFMDRSFDDVRVAEVADACGVSEKTVFNYFPTKESLVLDRLEPTVTALRDGLADRRVSPVEAALRILDRELAGLTSLLAHQDDPGRAAIQFRRFGLWHVQADSLRRHLASSSPVAGQVRERVAADVRRAARLIDAGLHAFGAPAPPGGIR